MNGEARSMPAYLWCVAVYPVLHLYSVNLGSVQDDEAWLACALSAAAAFALFALARRAIGAARAAALVGVALLVFYSWGHVAALVESVGLSPGWVLALPVAACAALAALLRPAAAASIEAARPILGVAAAALLMLPLLRIADYATGEWRRDEARVRAIGAAPADAPPVRDAPGRPDVYYIIVDGYSSNAHYLREWNYDNARFTDGLEQLGFQVAYDSLSNYGATLLSLSSSLNMRYEPENPAAGEVDDLRYLRESIANSEVAAQFVERGYEYVFFLSGFLTPSRFADLHVDFSPSGVHEHRGDPTAHAAHDRAHDPKAPGRFFKAPFLPELLETTLLRAAGDALEEWLEVAERPYRDTDPRRFLATLDRLPAVARMPEATFTFVHLLEPHGPIQFDREGRRTSKNAPTPRNFFGELEFVNRRLLDTIAEILRTSQHAPIIVLQGDHGTHLGEVFAPDGTLTHFEILNALYLPSLPSGRRPELPRDLSPVNTFGWVSNAYFGTQYEPLEARQYDFPGYEAPFDQRDVTREARRPKLPRKTGARPE